MSKILQRAAQKRKEIEESEEQVSAKSTKKSKTSSAAAARSKRVVVELSNIVYLGHIPHGFYEKEMRTFFRQFGVVKRLRLYRSKKTNGSKGYAFVEFETADIAGVVAQAVNGYFLNDRQLVCHSVAVDKVHTGMFAGPKKVEAATESDVPASENMYRDRLRAKAKRYCDVQTKKIENMRTKGIDFQMPVPDVVENL